MRVVPVGGAQPYEVFIGPGAQEELALVLAGTAKAVVVHAPPLAAAAGAAVETLQTAGVAAEAVVVPDGEAAKTAEVAAGCWEEFGRLGLTRSDAVVGVGGGAVTDLAGFLAATWVRGVRVVQVPTTLLGMVDAAIGGKTGVNTGKGKNLVGAFHFPWEIRIDSRFLATLPAEERRAGMAEVVKTGLLSGDELWSLPEDEMIRSCAAFKTAVVLSDPYEREGRRAILNLGHTFAHALETASGYELRHGDAVALGLLAALRLSGRSTDVVEEILAPKPVRVDRDRAWDALLRDKKGRLRLVLLGEDGGFVTEVPEADVRRALDELIAD